MIKKICLVCGRTFHSYPSHSDRPTCSRSCGNRKVWQDPDYRRRMSEIRKGKPSCLKGRMIDRKPQDVLRRFWSKVEKTTSCWIWKGTHFSKGYGAFSITLGKYRSKNVLAHRFSYALVRGPILNNLQIHHICNNTLCVNPAHLEAVSLKENVLRGNGITALNARKVFCKNGHLLQGENLYIKPSGLRICRICRRELDRKYYRDNRGEVSHVSRS